MLAFARSLIEWMGGVIRDTGGSDAVDEMETQKKRRKGRKGRQGGGAMGSEYGALDFRSVSPLLSRSVYPYDWFAFRHVHFFSSPTDLVQAFPLMRPKLVLAVPPTMSHGPSRWLFTAMANVDGNVILLTSRAEHGTLAGELYEQWERNQDETAKWGKGRIGNLAHLDGQLPIKASCCYCVCPELMVS